MTLFFQVDPKANWKMTHWQLEDLMNKIKNRTTGQFRLYNCHDVTMTGYPCGRHEICAVLVTFPNPVEAEIEDILTLVRQKIEDNDPVFLTKITTPIGGIYAILNKIPGLCCHIAIGHSPFRSGYPWI